jgi:WD repeat-containing protein 23
VRLYDVEAGWKVRKDVRTRMTRWTITDTALSPDQRFLVYASISSVAFLLNVGANWDVVSPVQGSRFWIRYLGFRI